VFEIAQQAATGSLPVTEESLLVGSGGVRARPVAIPAEAWHTIIRLHGNANEEGRVSVGNSLLTLVFPRFGEAI
jgi:hypothetical protein